MITTDLRLVEVIMLCRIEVYTKIIISSGNGVMNGSGKGFCGIAENGIGPTSITRNGGRHEPW